MKEQKKTQAQRLFVLFLRAVALIAMAQGLSYWAQLTGLIDGGTQRFDLLPVHWQVPSVVLAVLLPCASMGLWMLTSWGILLWTLASLLQVSIYGIWARDFVSRPVTVIGLTLALIAMFVFILLIAMQRHRERAGNY